MSLRFLLILSISTIFISCDKDEARACTTCTSDLTAAFEVCKESDGTASVNGENTGVDYNTYLDGLQETGTACGN